MSPRPRVRPRFEIETSLSPSDVVRRIKARMAQERDIDGIVLTDRVELVCGSSNKHFWSPQLTALLEPRAEGALLRARFGPHPHVWTLYVLIHSIGAFVTIGALMFGISQHLAGQTPWALWGLPAAPLLAAMVWSFAFIGQGLGADEMYQMRRFLEDALDCPNRSRQD